MKIRHPSSNRRRAFTMIEMVGVLAVIAILAGLLVPRVFSVITSAKVSAASFGISTVKSAAMMYYGKYGKFGTTNGLSIASTNLPFLGYDSNVLLREGFLDKPFDSPIGTASVQLVAALATSTAPDGTNAAFNLDGNSSYPNDAGNGSVVLEVVFSNMALEDAREINRRIDGENAILGESSTGTDTLGAVKYVYSGGAQTGSVYVYLAHK